MARNALMRRAAPYADLEQREFDAVVTMLSEGVATRRGRAGALVREETGQRGGHGGPRASRAGALVS